MNILLYVSAVITSPAGVSSSSRIMNANRPPRTKKNVIDPRYSSAMRLWSLVNNHDARPCPLLM